MWNCYNQAQFLNKKTHEVSCDLKISMKFFATSCSKNIIATLHIVTIEKSELTFFLKLYFHGFIFPWFLNVEASIMTEKTRKWKL